MKKVILVFVFLVQILHVWAGLNIETIRYCCGLGTNYANEGLKCESFQPPIAGIQKEDENHCIHSIEVCCRKQYQELQCKKGIEDANNSGICSVESGSQKDCCEACQLGIERGKSQQTCQDMLGLGPPYDTTFIKCCKEASSTSTTTTTTTTTSTTTENSPISEALKSTAPTDNQLSPLPPLENVCDIGDVCAQICIPTGNSYKCACNKGWSLMGDGISCKPDKRAAKKGDRCSVNNPCDQICIDTGVAIKCECNDGYELAKDKKTCKDIDECATGVHECAPSEQCVNDEGGYYCDDPNFLPDSELENPDIGNKCPQGYKFNFDKLVCDDIDECEFGIICSRPKTCVNTVGSFICEGEDIPQCPPGFQYKAAIDSCADIDECLTGENDCNKESQVCLNTKGNYTCVDKKSTRSCPAGFKKNPFTQNCDDINECEESENLCKPDENCVNELGGHTCVPKSESTKKTYEYPLRPPYEPALPPRPDLESSSSTSTTVSTTSTTTTTTTQKPVSCQSGYQLSVITNTCIDIDECREEDQACDSTQDCYNVPGSYVCHCKVGYTKDHQLGACIDINECQLGTHDCTAAQRCDNTIGSYLCARITGCGTGYTLNYGNGLCEDDDECALGTHTCNALGPNFKCRNTLGSYRCDPIRTYPKVYPTLSQKLPTTSTESSQTPATPQRPSPYPAPPSYPQRPQYVFPPAAPSSFPQQPSFVPPRIRPTPGSTQSYPILSGTLKKCLPGYIMNERGQCEDIDECESNPCPRGQKCHNFNGRYQCISELQCKIGYELDDSGEKCIDVNECSRGTHKCKPTQICKNGEGFYTCECPPGHHINPSTQLCEDIDECKYYRACSQHAECINTIGSYKCRCKEGLRTQGNYCEDIDECQETERLCEHTCVNIWGSYRCACKPGFTLNFDNRTCTDIDECDKFRDSKLCVGTCENIPGSYRCKCPKGYRLGSDHRTCIDIDECQQNVCPNHDDVCLNTRGGYKCYAITCPPNYFRDPQHKGRCKRPQSLCDPRDVQCILMPEQYTYHYVSLVSNFPISRENVQFFQIIAPKWSTVRAEYSMKLVNVIAPPGIERVNERYFKMVKSSHNTMQLFLVRSISGPQEIQLKVEMTLFQGNAMTANVVTYIFMVVSEYPF